MPTNIYTREKGHFAFGVGEYTSEQERLEVMLFTSICTCLTCRLGVMEEYANASLIFGSRKIQPILGAAPSFNNSLLFNPNMYLTKCRSRSRG